MIVMESMVGSLARAAAPAAMMALTHVLPSAPLAFLTSSSVTLPTIFKAALAALLPDMMRWFEEIGEVGLE